MYNNIVVAMVSRKKAKGKARKQAATKATVARGPLFSLLHQLRLRPHVIYEECCTHGWDPTEYPDDHDHCNQFLEASLQIIHQAKSAGEAVNTSIAITEEKYPQVWEDPTSLEWIASALVCMGVELTMPDIKNNKYLCTAVIAFSEYLHQSASELRKSQPAVYIQKVDELTDADERRRVSYLKKRINCSCLDARYNEVKILPKMGHCANNDCSLPGGMVELSSMLSCGYCQKEHYCSEECGMTRWEEHREDCKIWRKWNANGKSKMM